MICFKCKIQTVVAISSTEGELVGACYGGKIGKCIRQILMQIGYPPLSATRMYEDNAATIAIVNHGKSTPRTRHVAIQTFAVQDWRMEGSIFMVKIHKHANSADALTKNLDFVKFNRHRARMHGEHGSRNFLSTKNPVMQPQCFRKIIPGLA